MNNNILRIKIPKKPTSFYFEEAKLVMTEKNIKDFSKNFNFTYTLDYVNSKVTFYRREKD